MRLGIKKFLVVKLNTQKNFPIILHALGIILSSYQSWGITEKQNKNGSRFNMCSSHLSNAMNIHFFFLLLHWYSLPERWYQARVWLWFKVTFCPHCKTPKLKIFSLCFDSFQKHDDVRKNRNSPVSLQCLAELSLTQKSKYQSVHLLLHLSLKGCKCVWFGKDKDLHCTCLKKKCDVHITLNYMILGTAIWSAHGNPCQKNIAQKTQNKTNSRSGLSFKEFLKNQTSLVTIRQFLRLHLIHIRCSAPFCHAF